MVGFGEVVIVVPLFFTTTFEFPSFDSIFTSSPLFDSYSLTSPFDSILIFVLLVLEFVVVFVELKLLWTFTEVEESPSLVTCTEEVFALTC